MVWTNVIVWEPQGGIATTWATCQAQTWAAVAGDGCWSERGVPPSFARGTKHLVSIMKQRPAISNITTRSIGSWLDTASYVRRVPLLPC